MPDVITDHVTTGHVLTDDGVKLYYEEAGEGIPIVLVHESHASSYPALPGSRFERARKPCPNPG